MGTHLNHKLALKNFFRAAVSDDFLEDKRKVRARIKEQTKAFLKNGGVVLCLPTIKRTIAELKELNIRIAKRQFQHPDD